MKLQNSIINLILLVGVLSCVTLKNQKSKDSRIHELVILGKESGEISMNYFKGHHAISTVNQIIEKDFVWDSIKKNMVYKGKNAPIELTTLISYYEKNELDTEKAVIEDGYTMGIYKAGRYDNDIKSITYRKGNISGEFKITNFKDSILYQTTFKKGNGYWKDYFYKEGKLREEGKVKNNFKTGVWNYYNLFEKTDSTKVYTQKDSVDVRYPHCFFNKKEPCY